MRRGGAKKKKLRKSIAYKNATLSQQLWLETNVSNKIDEQYKSLRKHPDQLKPGKSSHPTGSIEDNLEPPHPIGPTVNYNDPEPSYLTELIENNSYPEYSHPTEDNDPEYSHPTEDNDSDPPHPTGPTVNYNDPEPSYLTESIANDDYHELFQLKRAIEIDDDPESSHPTGPVDEHEPNWNSFPDIDPNYQEMLDKINKDVDPESSYPTGPVDEHEPNWNSFPDIDPSYQEMLDKLNKDVDRDW
ncbi:hypothetical protein FSHL1_010488 [Fusarium sambucinum]